MNIHPVPDTVLGAEDIVMKKTDVASALIEFIPRWFGRLEDDGINSEGGLHQWEFWKANI